MILTVTANAAIDKRYVVTSFDVGSVNRVKSVELSAGGKGLNVSRTARIAGEDVIATGFLGGHSGEFIQEKLKAEGVREDFIWCIGETRSCINIWDENHHTQTEFLEPGARATQQNQDSLVKKFTELAADCSVAAISGSMPEGCTPELYKRMLAAGKKAGKKVILDTSGKTLEECLDDHPFMIKPNIDEIQMLVGRKLNPDDTQELLDAAKELHARGIPAVVISLGSSGSLMSCEEGAFQALVPKIDAVNTVGCGDAMIGGFCTGIARGLSMPESLKLASAVSAAAAMTNRTGFFRMEDMKKLEPQIEIRKLR
ncbi:MAG TPA: 1-phosphofructokinase [Lachnospiraceae bacterium]|nr:1-phosphofructokinase [Lachnospiraceae bacterium]MDD7048925.1 1-phosphofructokinase [Lachnospiraceae bacterium]HBB60457.1 1-phosphofructokinase [Lachnospiraceae bacterium]